MTVSSSPITAHEPLRVRGLEMPWNRLVNNLDGEVTHSGHALSPARPQEFLAECVEVRSESGGIMTFVFRRTDGQPLSFRAGQYLNVEFPVHGTDADPIDRSYSISSAPTEPWTFTVSIKRDGLVSQWAHDNLRPGMVLDMLGPVGAFHLPDADRRARFLLLGAGAGITPLMSMIRTIHALPGNADVVLLYHAGDPQGFAFSQELEYLQNADSRIKVFWSLGDREAPGGWVGMKGRLTAAMLNEVAPDANGRQVYACGPSGYLEAAEQLLLEAGVDDTSIHMEFFTGDRQTILEYAEEVAIASELAAEETATVESAPDVYGPEADFEADGVGDPVTALNAADIAQEAQESLTPAGEEEFDTSNFQTVGEGDFTVSFVRSQVNVRVKAGERILRKAQNAGVRIPANCEEGMCGSCKSVKLCGDVEMNHQGGIRQREIDNGKFLPCCSTPLTDVIVDA